MDRSTPLPTLRLPRRAQGRLGPTLIQPPPIRPRPVLAAARALAAGAVLALLAAAGPATACDGLLVYAGAGFRSPIEEAAAAFAAREGVPVEATFAGSGCLLAQAELAGRGDVFIPGETHYLEQAQARDLAGSGQCVAWLRPVIAVAAGNPRGIGGPGDLAQPGLRLGLGDPTSVAVGLASERWLEATLDPAIRSAVLENVTTRALNVNELGAQLSLGAIDAAIVWDATVPLFAGLEAVVSESSLAYRTRITGAALRLSRWPEESARFLAFLAGPEGQAIFRAHGYEPYTGETLAPVEATGIPEPEPEELPR